jgi:hypothetical protein
MAEEIAVKRWAASFLPLLSFWRLLTFKAGHFPGCSSGDEGIFHVTIQ